MKLPARCVAWVLPLLLTGCPHVPGIHSHQSQVQPLAPPIDDVPQPKPAPSAPAEIPPPVSTTPSQPTVAESKTETPPRAQPMPPVKHKKPAAAAPPQPAPPPSPPSSNQQASNEGVSAIGNLSLGDSPNLRLETSDTIASTERGLNGIGRKLNDQEKKTATQIREFLKQAKAALFSGDVDGAHTLAAKAKVLLGELSQ